MPTEVAIAWYSAEEWEDWKQVALDPEVFEETHAEWIAQAEARIRELTGFGCVVRKVPIRIDEFLLWCKQRGCGPDSGARASYAGAHIS